MSDYPRWLFPLALLLIAVHLNYWMWDDVRLVFGLPVNLLYHVVYSLALYPILRVVVRKAWPRFLSDD